MTARLLAGPVIWFVHFSLLYGLAGFGPSFGVSPASVRIFGWVITIAAVAALAVMAWRIRRQAQDAMGGITVWLAALSLVAVLFQAAVLWLVPASTLSVLE